MAAPKLLAPVRAAARLKQFSVRTEEAYASWIRRFVLHHGTRHPATMSADEIRSFLS